MARYDLINDIAVTTELSPRVVKAVLMQQHKIIEQQLLKGERVDFRGFGTFYPKLRKKKKGRLISENKEIEIPEHFVVGFKPARELSKKLKDKK